MLASHVIAVNASGRGATGYLVAPRLVLTSAHLSTEVGDAASVAPAVSDRTYGGVVVWMGRPGGRDDAALVEITDPGWSEPAAKTFPQWGRLVTAHSGIACSAWGFPQWMSRPGAGPRSLQMTGHINAGSRFEADRVVVSLDEHPPTPSDGHSSPWAGFSGSAVFCGSLLTAVVASDVAGGSSAALECVAVSVLLADLGFCEVLRRFGASDTRLRAVETMPIADYEVIDVDSPASLLRARAGIVDFHGRDSLMDSLESWAEGTGIQARLLHGAGGRGKSRVAHELSLRLERRRWAAVWIRADANAGALDVLADVTVPLLVVVDYADTRTAQIATIVRACAHHRSETPIRLLLLSRAAGAWWRQLPATSREAETVLSGALLDELPELADADDPECEMAYRSAVDRFASEMDAMARHHPRRFEDIARELRRSHRALTNGNPLAIQITALADLLDADESSGGARTGTEEDRLLHHEKRYWLRTAGQRNVRLPMDVLEAVLAAAMLFGAENDSEAEAVVHSVPALEDLSRAEAKAIALLVCDLYPAQDDGGSWGMLLPDRLNERLIAGGLLAEPELFFAATPRLSSAQVGHLIAVLARIKQNPQVGPPLRRRFAEFVQRDPSLVGKAVRSPVDPYLMIDALVDVDGAYAEALLRLFRTSAQSLLRLRDDERLGQLEFGANQLGDSRMIDKFRDWADGAPIRTQWTSWNSGAAEQVLTTSESAVRFLSLEVQDGSPILLIGDAAGDVRASRVDADPRPWVVAHHGSPLLGLVTFTIDGAAHAASIDRRGTLLVTAVDDGIQLGATLLSSGSPWHSVDEVHLAAVPVDEEVAVVVVLAGRLWVVWIGLGTEQLESVLLNEHACGGVTALAVVHSHGDLHVFVGCSQGRVDRVVVRRREDGREVDVDTVLDNQWPRIRTETERSWHRMGRTLSNQAITALTVHTWSSRTVVAVADACGRLFLLWSHEQGDRRRRPFWSNRAITAELLMEFGILDAPKYFERVGSLELVEANGSLHLLRVATFGYDQSEFRSDVIEWPADPWNSWRRTVRPMPDGEWQVVSASVTGTGRIVTVCLGEPAVGIRLLAPAVPGSSIVNPVRYSRGPVARAASVLVGDQVVIASAQADIDGPTSIVAHRLDASVGQTADDLARDVWDTLVGQRLDGEPMLVFHYGARDSAGERSRYSGMEAYRIHGSGHSEKFLENDDYVWNRFENRIYPRTRRALKGLPIAVSAYSRASMRMGVINGFLRESGVTVELVRSEAELRISSRGPAHGEVLYAHPATIYAFTVLELTGGRNVLLVADADHALFAVTRRGTETVRRELVRWTASVPTSVRIAQLGADIVLVIPDRRSGEVWMTWLLTDTQPILLGQIDGEIQDVIVLASKDSAAVAVIGGGGRISLLEIGESPRGPIASIELGVSVDGLVQYDNVLLATSRWGVTALNMPELPAYMATEGPRAAIGESPTKWLDDDPEPPPPAPPRALETLRSIVVPWVRLLVLGAAAFAVAGPHWTLVPWLYLAVLIWMEPFTDLTSWRWRSLGAAALLAAGEFLDSQGLDGLVRALVAFPVAVLAMSWLSPQFSGLDGNPVFGRRAPADLVRDLHNAFRFPPLLASAQSNRAFLSGVLAMYLASLSWNALLNGALLPVLGGLAGLAIIRRRHVMYRPAHGSNILAFGFVLGVLAPIPVVPVLTSLIATLTST